MTTHDTGTLAPGPTAGQYLAVGTAFRELLAGHGRKALNARAEIKAEGDPDRYPEDFDDSVDYGYCDRAKVTSVTPRDDGGVTVGLSWPACLCGCSGSEYDSVVVPADEADALLRSAFRTFTMKGK